MSSSYLFSILNTLKSILVQVAAILNSPGVDPTIPSNQASVLAQQIPSEANILFSECPSLNQLYAAIDKKIGIIWHEMNLLILEEIKDTRKIFWKKAKVENQALLEELRNNERELEAHRNNQQEIEEQKETDSSLKPRI